VDNVADELDLFSRYFTPTKRDSCWHGLARTDVKEFAMLNVEKNEPGVQRKMTGEDEILGS
jgi:lipopolysaccharide biosynthesis protein